MSHGSFEGDRITDLDFLRQIIRHAVFARFFYDYSHELLLYEHTMRRRDTIGFFRELAVEVCLYHDELSLRKAERFDGLKQ